MSGIEFFQSDRVSAEYEQNLDAAEAQGFSDGFNGLKCKPHDHKYFGLAATLYGKAYKLGKAARQ